MVVGGEVVRTKPRQKTGKVHAAMTPEKMRQLRKIMGFSLRDLAAVMRIPYRTLQDYEYGARRISACFATKLEAELERELRIQHELHVLIDQRISEEHPHGIPSAPERD